MQTLLKKPKFLEVVDLILDWAQIGAALVVGYYFGVQQLSEPGWPDGFRGVTPFGIAVSVLLVLVSLDLGWGFVLWGKPPHEPGPIQPAPRPPVLVATAPGAELPTDTNRKRGPGLVLILALVATLIWQLMSFRRNPS